MTPTALGEALSNSLSLGSILVLTAIGLAITFGVMRVINMAHGEMLMLGAYTAFVVTDPQLLPSWLNEVGAACGFEWHIELNLFYAIPIAFLVVGFVGYLTEVFLIRYLYGRPLDTLLATWGLGLVFQQLVLLTFGANLKAVELPKVLVGNLQIGELAIPHYRIFIVGFTLLCLLLVYLWFYGTSSGLKIPRWCKTGPWLPPWAFQRGAWTRSLSPSPRAWPEWQGASLAPSTTLITRWAISMSLTPSWS